jgi:transglutaminase-like putative cysteine protease
MAMVGEITHTTTYTYAKPVSFGTHRAMFLPRRGASARLLGWSAATNPPSKIRWVTDARSNSVTLVEFGEPSRELTFTFRVRGVFFGVKGIESFPLEARADEIPVQYTPARFPCSRSSTSVTAVGQARFKPHPLRICGSLPPKSLTRLG